MTFAEVKKKLADKVAEAKAFWEPINEAFEKEGQEPTDEQRARLDAMREEIESLDEMCKRIQADRDRGQWVSDVTAYRSPKGHIGSLVPGPVTDREPTMSDVNTRRIPAQVRRERSRVFADDPVLGISGEKLAYGFSAWFLATQTHNMTCAQWLQDHMGIPIAETMSSTSNIAGGALVPEIYASGIIDYVEQFGVARKYAEVVRMDSDTLNYPIITGGQTAYFTGEAENPTESDIATNNLKLVVKDLATMTVVPEQLLADASVNLGDLIAKKGALAIATKEDQCCFLGDGTSTYGGIVGLKNKLGAGSKVTAASGHTSFETLDNADFAKAIGKFPHYAAAQPTWFIHRVGWGASMLRLAMDAGGNVVQNITSTTVTREYAGFPVVITQLLNSTLGADASELKCWFGDLSMAVLFGDRQQIRFASDAGGKYFQAGTRAFKTTSRFDIVVHSIDSTSVAGPMIALYTAAS